MSICVVLKVVGTEGMVLTAAIIPGKNFGKRCKMVMFRQKVITIPEATGGTETMVGVIMVIMADTMADGRAGILQAAIMEGMEVMEDIMAEDMVVMEEDNLICQSWRLEEYSITILEVMMALMLRLQVILMQIINVR